jgi:hypothetical protein
MVSVRAIVIALSCLCFQAGVASADDASPPKATATRPAKEPAGQSSLPSNAPAATTTQPTASTNQDAATKKMNEDAKKQVETEGK